MEKSKFKPNGVALVPFLIFVVVYLGIGVTLVAKGDPMGFYGFKGPVAYSSLFNAQGFNR